MGDVIQVLWGDIIESTTNRPVDEQGYVDSAVTSIDLEEETIILELHGYFSAKNSQTSLLSTFKAREAGAIVNDIARRQNGKHNIEYDGYEI